MTYYKYLPIDRIKYFEDELLRFTQPGNLNDPFECLPQKPQEQELKNLIDSLIQISPKINEQFETKIREKYDATYLNNLYEEAYRNVNNDLAIFSLSKKWNNTLMWSHYTIAHQGFCIGFDTNHSFFKDYISPDGTSSKVLKKVKYSTNRVKIPMVLGQSILNYEPYTTKSLDWKYEQEMRLISSLNLADKIEILKPYNIYLFKIPIKSINEIILGANIDLDKEKKIRKFALENKINLFKAKISDTKYDMERV